MGSTYTATSTSLVDHTVQLHCIHVREVPLTRSQRSLPLSLQRLALLGLSPDLESDVAICTCEHAAAEASNLHMATLA